jgi:hypothetical protein
VVTTGGILRLRKRPDGRLPKPKQTAKKCGRRPVSHQVYFGCLTLRLIGADLESVLPWGNLLVF